MPPLKEFVFFSIENPFIKITINHYSFEEAYNTLVKEVKHPADFQIK